MSEPATIAEARTTPSEPSEQAAPDAEPQAEELLIEEVSIDGMCGVY
ncbi:MAG TPA: mycofactocin precursor MftA [Streptosporangiaceae bacterium]